MIAELRARDPLLFWTGALMAAGLAVAMVAAIIDTRLVLGINPWIKPIKFLTSITIFLWSAAWFMAETRPRPRARAVVRWVFVVAMVTEISLIALQAGRGTTSHFNVGTPLDGAIFAVMGLMITVNTVGAMLLLWLLRRDTPTYRTGYLWGVRLGVALFILASLQGWLIVGHMAHTVPGPDGGPGLPLVNWSTEHGDLRVAHFFGMHALQALPLLGYILDRATTAAAPTRRLLVLATAIAWIAVMAALLTMALRGHPLVQVPLNG